MLRMFYIYIFSVHACVACVCIHSCTDTLAGGHLWRSEDNMQEFVLFFHHVNFGAIALRLGLASLATGASTC